MGEAAVSRRVTSRLGDLAFSLFAGGLGLALLFATGRHLFAAPVAVTPQTVAHVTVLPTAPVATAAVSGATRVAPAATHETAEAVRAAPVAIRVPPPRAAGPVPATRLSRSIVRGGAAPLHAPASPRRSVRAFVPTRTFVIAAAPRGAVAGPSRRTAAVRPRRLAVNLPTMLPKTAKPRASARPRPPVARREAPPRRARIARRPPRRREPSIIEPPLGYDAQPALVLAPGSTQLELGDAVLPTIRSKRRH